MEGAQSVGHSVEFADLYAEHFDPILTERDLQQFKGVAMPDDVQREQARIERSDALCLIFPIWWYGPPAMMKGWFDTRFSGHLMVSFGGVRHGEQDGQIYAGV